MGLFDKMRSAVSGVSTMKTPVEIEADLQQAAAVAMIAMCAIDGDIGESEVSRIHSIMARNNIFAYNSKDKDTEILDSALRIIQDCENDDAIFSFIKKKTPDDWRMTIIAILAELAFADDAVNEDERDLILKCGEILGIHSSEVRSALVVYGAFYKKNPTRE